MLVTHAKVKVGDICAFEYFTYLLSYLLTYRSRKGSLSVECHGMTPTPSKTGTKSLGLLITNVHSLSL